MSCLADVCDFSTHACVWLHLIPLWNDAGVLLRPVLFLALLTIPLFLAPCVCVCVCLLFSMKLHTWVIIAL